MLFAAEFPFISVNLDFSNSTLTDDCAPAIRIGPDAKECAAVAGHVVNSCYIPTSIGRIGLIARSPADFFNVVDDPAKTLPGIDFVGGRDPETNQPLLSAVPMVAKQVSLLEDMGVNIIVLLDHAQDFTSDPLLTSLLSGIDVIVSAGSTGFFGQASPFGPYNTLRPGDEPTANYPVVQTDKNGDKVLLVNSDQQYLYVGHLIAEFDSVGKLITWDGRSGPIATTKEAIDLFTPVPEPNCDVEGILDTLKGTKAIKDAFTVVGETVFPLNGARADVRTKETNLARLVADSTLWAGNAYAKENNLTSVDIAFKNGGGIRDSITGPNIIRLTIQAALAFDNKQSLVSVNGEQLLAALENAVSRVPAGDGRYPQTAGMFMEYDVSKPGVEAAAALSKPSRVKTLKVDDVSLIEKFVPVDDLVCFNFTIVTNSFLATGGDGFNAFSNGTILGETEMGEQQILEEYIDTKLKGMVNITEPPKNPRVFRVGTAATNTTESSK
jgi:2',3'-cyclic-nucleotide 2'-phosphodiesterase (5'-nucleotidase family)